MENQIEEVGIAGIWIPYEIAMDDRLKWPERVLWGVIRALSRGRSCTATNEYLARTMRAKNSRMIERYLHTLNETGWIHIPKAHSRHRKIYATGHFTPLESPTKMSEKTDKNVATDRQICRTDIIEDNIKDNKQSSFLAETGTYSVRKQVAHEKVEIERIIASWNKHATNLPSVRSANASRRAHLRQLITRNKFGIASFTKVFRWMNTQEFYVKNQYGFDTAIRPSKFLDKLERAESAPISDIQKHRINNKSTEGNGNESQF